MVVEGMKNENGTLTKFKLTLFYNAPIFKSPVIVPVEIHYMFPGVTISGLSGFFNLMIGEPII